MLKQYNKAEDWYKKLTMPAVGELLMSGRYKVNMGAGPNHILYN